ncbi:dihydrofolate synthase / folylpolyglutamate synthase [Acetitomaculum ruminis DSM 5522]|uniref:tetrahydrofolate synthase n=1 Tax=Acetitomaculum ruminis DSM 5522 TaxID=1120918 RepID=A0A1I0XSM4_9FIRM|nr:folylpolyglutamate synthase/dihydrofolate synthase family protein [Acetitomaculum ruminis]SFB04012.1 dihydrofolate synthase / folylpolyglutamate synthase [Acetitomaculum ruminis DSM 5522]
MNFDEANEYLQNASLRGRVYGLERVKRLMKALSNPEDELKIVHVAGTNGKGSTVAFISKILEKAGYKVGVYTSPTIVTYWERIQINGEIISEDAVASLISKLADIINNEFGEEDDKPTVFEIETAMAFLYFKEQNCDIVIIETGLGGLTDATNFINNTLLSAISSISLDHMDVLGDSIAEIAKNKAGIMKKGAMAVCLQQEPQAMKVLKEKADELDIKLRVAKKCNIYDIKHGFLTQHFSYKNNKETIEDVETGLLGTYQLENASLAIEAALALKEAGFDITLSNIKEGIKDTQLVGRFTKLSEKPLFIVDGAHNADAAVKLKKTVETYLKGMNITFIIGVLADKEYKKIIDTMMDIPQKIYTITPPNPRALDAKELAEDISKVNKNVTACESIYEAIKLSMENTKEDEAILAFGSLYYLGDVVRSLKEYKGEK